MRPSTRLRKRINWNWRGGHRRGPLQEPIAFRWLAGSTATIDSCFNSVVLHRCLQRHNISRLADLLPADEKGKTKAFKDYKPGYLHIDTAQVNLGKEKWYLFVAIDRATRFVYVELHDNKRMGTAEKFLKQTIAQYPFKVEKILTDNGIEFGYNLLTGAKKPKDGRQHPFEKLCSGQHIEHRTTLVKHPWTNGMVEAMNKKIKANTTKRFHYENATELRTSLCLYP